MQTALFQNNKGIDLKRDDKALSITFIGTGSAFTKKFYQNNALVVKEDEHILIDCGTRTPEALSKLGLSVTNIKNYLITHSHADHIGGLEEVMLMYRYMAHSRGTIIAPKKYRKLLWQESLKGGASYNEINDGKYLQFDDMWDTIELKAVKNADRELCTTRLGSLSIAMLRTMHIPNSAPDWKSSALSYGVILDEKVFFTSDTLYDPDLLDFVLGRYNIEIIFHDCQLYSGGVHASFDELSSLPEEIREKMYLMHYGDNVENFEQTALDRGFKGFVKPCQSYVFN
ncbi:MBL fold metallo-hydrolase [Spirochaetota bacterium]